MIAYGRSLVLFTQRVWLGHRAWTLVQPTLYMRTLAWLPAHTVVNIVKWLTNDAMSFYQPPPRSHTYPSLPPTLVKVGGGGEKDNRGLHQKAMWFFLFDFITKRSEVCRGPQSEITSCIA
jgi:hypothetical protein